MASNTQEEILKEFETMAWQASADGSAGGASALEDASPVDQAMGLTAAATPAGQNVRGGSESETTSGGGGSTAATVIKDIFETGLGVVPLIGGLLGLFGSGGEAPPAPVKYQMPSSISFMSADVGHELLAADYDQMGLARQYDSSGYGISDLAASDPAELAGMTDVPYDTQAADRGLAPDRATGQQTPNAPAAPQITVNVQAMDAQSFLDRSNDIAQAVRSAMLTMSSINDVVNDL